MYRVFQEYHNFLVFNNSQNSLLSLSLFVITPVNIDTKLNREKVNNNRSQAQVSFKSIKHRRSAQSVTERRPSTIAIHFPIKFPTEVNFREQRCPALEGIAPRHYRLECHAITRHARSGSGCRRKLPTSGRMRRIRVKSRRRMRNVCI